VKVFHPDGDEAGDAGDYEHPFDSVQQPSIQMTTRMTTICMTQGYPML
jgi:hypothetical protein